MVDPCPPSKTENLSRGNDLANAPVGLYAEVTSGCGTRVPKSNTMLLGRLAGMTEGEFDEEVRVTSDMIHCYLLAAPGDRTRSRIPL